MKHPNGLQRTIMAAAVAVLAFGAAPAMAADNVAATGHISASVGSTLSIAETTPIRFGNFTAVCTTSPCNGSGNIVLNNLTSARTLNSTGHDTLVLLHGLNGVNGVPAGADKNGSETAGVYHISGVTGGAVAGTTHIYITLATNTNVPIPTLNGVQVGATPVVTLTDAQNATGVFDVNAFTWDSTGNDPIYGDYIATAGGVADVHLGATLNTDSAATAYSDGAYLGTFNIMASY